MIGKNMAPGLNRNFASEEWPRVKREYWHDARRTAWEVMNEDKLNIIGSDIDKEAIKAAKENAENIGLEEDIKFIVKDIRDLKINDQYGVIISNPPYGERLGNKKEIEELYIDMGGKIFKKIRYLFYIYTDFQRGL